MEEIIQTNKISNGVNKTILITISFIFILIAGVLFFFFAKPEEPKVILKKGINITYPEANGQISSPVKITGYINGDGWIPFEGQAGLVKLLDSDGREIGSSILNIPGDWMKLPVDFEAELEFSAVKDEIGTLLFLNENPIGMPENNKELRLPVGIIGTKGETIKVKVYYNNSKMDPEFSCNKVFPIEKEIVKTWTVGRAALQELLSGPTNTEKEQGYFSSINPGVKIHELAIENGVATVDFDEQLEYQVGGSCRIAAIRAQITETLKQFPTVEEVIISINGRTEDILQP